VKKPPCPSLIGLDGPDRVSIGTVDKTSSQLPVVAMIRSPSEGGYHMGPSKGTENIDWYLTGTVRRLGSVGSGLELVYTIRVSVVVNVK